MKKNNVGRPSVGHREVESIKILRLRGYSLRQIASITGYGKSTVAKYVISSDGLYSDCDGITLC